MASRYMNFLRKNAKPVLAVMGVVCMVTFVVGPYLLDLVAGSGARREEDNPVAVTWANGSVRESELQTLRYYHQVAYQFLGSVVQATIDQGGTPVINGRPVQKGQQFFDVGIPPNLGDDAMVETMLMAEEAKRLGIVVDQAAVKEYLKQISSPELAEGDWLEIAKSVLGDSGQMTVGQLFEHLAYELRAQHMRVLANAGMLAIPPGELWGYFNRLNRRVNIEAYPVEVAQFVAQVKTEPSEAEVQTLFSEGKYRDPNPNLAEPGFHKPHKVAFTYVKVDFKPFLEEAKKQITDQQVEEQYQKDISQGMHKVLELPGIKPGEEKKDGEKPPEEKKDADAAKPTEEKKDDKPSDEKKEGVPPENAKPDGDDCQATEQPQDAQKATAEQPASEKPAEAKAGEAKAEDKPADAKPADAKPAETPPAGETKFKPLEEVREEIRTRLAQPIAQEAKNKAVKEVMDAINDYGRRYRRWLSVKEFKKEKAEEPAKLDLAALAAKHGFEVGTTPLVDRFTAAEYEVGKNVMTFDMEALRRGDPNIMRTFSDIAFGEEDTLYDPREGNSVVPDVSYIYFRTAEEKAADVTLEEVRKRIVEAWKTQRAFELAKEEAKKLAEKARGAKSLSEAVAEPMKVVTPPAFSWMSTGSLAMGFGEPELSRVPDVDLPGQEFMQAVFALKQGETGIAPNQAHSKVYVVRLIDQEPSDDVLRERFLEAGLNFQVVGIAQRDRMQTTYDWYRDIEKRYDVTWHRPAREARGRAF